MKKIILLLLSLIFLTTCNPSKHVIIPNNEYDKQYATEMIVTKAQLDSICIADTLSQSFQDWYCAAFVDYQTNKSKEKKIYGKYTKNKRIYYILSPYDKNHYKLMIRTEEKEIK